jgi:hypothetical protein
VKCLEVAAAKENQSFQGGKRLEKIGTLFNIRTGWWFGTFLFSPIVGRMIQSDYYFSGGLKPPTRRICWNPAMTSRYFQPSRWMKPSTRPHQIDSTSW